ncbi:MAG: acyloxyacyl hydrolase [Muribaculaceae bacterium]|nr:acyloxyacyl hydrolase [Muribaculaceae bacterium]MDE6631964.1 acyloxyacyl hydrolase [Muribaculaceae bacterium]
MQIKSVILLVVIAVYLSASASDSIGWRHSVGIDVRPSYPFPSYRDDILRNHLDVGNARKTKFAASVHLQYSFSFPRNSRQGSIFPDAWQGLGTAVNFLGNHKGIGSPISLYAFQGAPVWKMSERFSLYYEWNFGASFGWRPCDGVIARSNLIVGSRVNAYINVGAGINCRLDDSYALMAGVDLTHYSNGNTSFPNPGVNMAGLRVGVTRTFGNRTEKASNYAGQDADSIKKRKKLHFDVTAYGAWRRRVYRGGESPILLKGHYAVAGLDISPMWQIKEIFRAGASLDFQWDQSTDLKRHHAYGDTPEDIRFYRPPILSQICAGISGRAELVMPVFSVNVGIGYNFIGPPETRASYQLANLKVRFTERWFLNIGYQLLNFQKQNNLMLGIGYSFR